MHTCVYVAETASAIVRPKIVHMGALSVCVLRLFVYVNHTLVLEIVYVRQPCVCVFV